MHGFLWSHSSKNDELVIFSMARSLLVRLRFTCENPYPTIHRVFSNRQKIKGNKLKKTIDITIKSERAFFFNKAR